MGGTLGLVARAFQGQLKLQVLEQLAHCFKLGCRIRYDVWNVAGCRVGGRMQGVLARPCVLDDELACAVFQPAAFKRSYLALTDLCGTGCAVEQQQSDENQWE